MKLLKEKADLLILLTVHTSHRLTVQCVVHAAVAQSQKMFFNDLIKLMPIMD